jgi:hypothetical protein
MPAPLHQRLLNEATLMATEQILGQMPAEYSPALAQTVYQAVRYGIRQYVEGMELLTRLSPCRCEGSAAAPFRCPPNRSPRRREDSSAFKASRCRSAA